MPHRNHKATTNTKDQPPSLAAKSLRVLLLHHRRPFRHRPCSRRRRKGWSRWTTNARERERPSAPNRRPPPSSRRRRPRRRRRRNARSSHLGYHLPPILLHHHLIRHLPHPPPHPWKGESPRHAVAPQRRPPLLLMPRSTRESLVLGPRTACSAVSSTCSAVSALIYSTDADWHHAKLCLTDVC